MELGGKTALEIVVEEPLKQGFDDLLFTVGRNAKQIINYVDARFKSRCDCAYLAAYDNEGTAAPFRRRRELLTEPFMVVYVDVVHDEFDENRRLLPRPFADLARAHSQNDAAATILLRPVPEPQVSSVGIAELAITTDSVATRHGARVTQLREKPQPAETSSRLGLPGMYVFSDDIGELLARGYEDYPNPAEYHWGNVLDRILKEHKVVRGLVRGGSFRDFGTSPSEYLAVNRAMLRRDNGVRLGMDVVFGEGVLLHPPVTICDRAELRDSAEIGPYAVIGEGARIGADARVVDTVIQARALVGQRAVLEHSIVGHDARVREGGAWADYMITRSGTKHFEEHDRSLIRVANDRPYTSFNAFGPLTCGL